MSASLQDHRLGSRFKPGARIARRGSGGAGGGRVKRLGA